MKSIQLESLKFNPPLKIKGYEVSSKETLLIEQDERLAEIPYIKHLMKGELHEIKEDLHNHLDLTHVQFALGTLKLTAPKSRTIKLQRLSTLFNNREDILTSILESKTTPSCIKIKIARQPIDKDILDLNWLLEKSPSCIQFRLDANQSYKREELLKWGPLYQKHSKSIEYFEEPLEDGLSYEELKIPFALDESAKDYLDKKLIASPCSLVIKPSLWGRPQDTLECLQKTSLPITVSSTYEGPIGMIANFWLASHFPNSYHGLDTLYAYDQELADRLWSYGTSSLTLKKELYD